MPHIFDLSDHMCFFSFTYFVKTKIALSIVNLVGNNKIKQFIYAENCSYASQTLYFDYFVYTNASSLIKHITT